MMRRFLSILLVCLLAAGLACAEGAAPKLPINFSPGMKLDDSHFISDMEYEDPTIHVVITTGREDECDYWIADITIGDASQLRTAAADGFDSNMVMKGERLARRMNAVLAIDGDYFFYSGRGYIMRQGELYLNNLRGGRDVLMIDEDGDFHVVIKAEAGSVNARVDGKKVINAFFFGPALVVDGKVTSNFNWPDMASGYRSQRVALCQVGPLHYKAIVCAAPFRGSAGMTMEQFAKFVAKQDVQVAYNFDGGDSSMLIFGGKKLNDVDNPKTRDIADIVYFASAYGADE